MTLLKFGPHTITSNEIFFVSKYTFGLIDVLCITRRVVPRFTDLTEEEVKDLFLSAQTIGSAIQKQYGASSLNIAIQDGPEAGQSVPHCHVHILPRVRNDYNRNDDVYVDLEKHEQKLSNNLMEHTGAPVDFEAERVVRTKLDMAAEANVLRKLFSQSEDIWAEN
ncbi:hypothetical protein HK096_009113 [Nowakowskiella sp. JEL0078]|nr:hypothetical protein HK096_009113 [Nowakowskiella sp. JEL0078]